MITVASTVDITPRSLTQAEETWAELNDLASMPEVVTFTTRPVSEWVAGDGATYRSAGFIVASPHSRRRFRIALRPGADEDDLTWFRMIVERARLGYFSNYGWTADEGADGSTIYRFALCRKVEVPHLNRWGRCFREVEPCEVAACVHSHHVEDLFHSTEVVAGDDGYEIRLVLPGLDPAARWYVDVDATGSFEPAGAGSFASDLQWAAGECRKLNAELEEASE
jgi:hypothetical protein